MKKTVYYLVPLLLSTAVFVSCETQPEQQIPAGYETTQLNPDFETDVEFIKSASQAFFAGDAEAIDQYLHEDYTSGGPDFQTYTRQDEIDGWVNFAQQFENARLENEIYYSLIVDTLGERPEMHGKWVLMWADMHYTRISDGKDVSFPIHVTFKLEDDKLVYAGTYYDRLSMFRQIGYELVPPDEDLEGEEEPVME
jgi:hypothetical protein